MQVFLIVC